MRRAKSATPGGVRFRRSAGFSALISATVTPAARATVDRSTLLGTTTRSNSHGGSGTTPAEPNPPRVRPTIAAAVSLGTYTHDPPGRPPSRTRSAHQPFVA